MSVLLNMLYSLDKTIENPAPTKQVMVHYLYQPNMKDVMKHHSLHDIVLKLQLRHIGFYQQYPNNQHKHFDPESKSIKILIIRYVKIL